MTHHVDDDTQACAFLPGEQTRWITAQAGALTRTVVAVRGEEVTRLPLPLHPADLHCAVQGDWTVHVVSTGGTHVDDVEVHGTPQAVDAFNAAMLEGDTTAWLRTYVAGLALD